MSVLIVVTFQEQKNPAVFTNRANERRSGTTRNRTGDTRIFSPLLYQLSYGTFAITKPYFCFAVAKVHIIF